MMCQGYISNEKLLKIIIDKYQLNPEHILQQFISSDRFLNINKIVKITQYNVNEAKYNCLGQTVLHWAVNKNKVECIRELMKLGARNLNDMNGQTPSDLAREKGYAQIADYIENYKHLGSN